MDFAFSEEQEAFRETLRRFFEEKSPSAEVRRSMVTPEGCDPDLWKRMGEELGLQGVCIPEAYGGQGFGFLELGLVFEEMGRALVCAPYFSTAGLAAHAILAAGSEADRQRWLPGIASGETIATLAVLDAGDDWDPAAVTLEARRDGDGFRLAGRKRLVTDGALAGLLIVAARLPGSAGLEGVTLVAVEAGAPGVSRTPLESLDLTRKLAHVEFDGAVGSALGEPGAAGRALASALDRGRVCLALEAAGGAERCLEAAVGYAKQRIQFGRPIGSFQAIKHRCAELLLEVESAKCAAHWAGWVASRESDDLAAAASVAKAFCDEAYRRAADDNIHIHGGIGVTWAADPHLYAKRAKANEILLGDPTWHHRRIAASQGF